MISGELAQKRHLFRIKVGPAHWRFVFRKDLTYGADVIRHWPHVWH